MTTSRWLGMTLLLATLAAAGSPAPTPAAATASAPTPAGRAAARAPAGETAAAREQARLCERLNREEGLAACRSALALGVGAARRGPLRQILARHLVSLEKWDELAELLREEVRLAPRSAAGWKRLGTTLLFALDERAEALAALAEAARLAPGDADTRVTLGVALAAEGKLAEASATLREALRIDPAALEGRSAARAVLEASEAGRSWP